MEKTKLFRSSAVKLNTKRAILSAAWLILSARNALAANTLGLSDFVSGNAQTGYMPYSLR
jgi:hypothetical protein